MKLTTLAVILCAFLFPAPARAQDGGRSLEEAIIETVRAYKNRDETALNSLVAKDHGIAFVYRPGARENISVADTFSFADPVPGYLEYVTEEFEPEYTVHFEALPDFDCYDFDWNKPPGIYCDTLHRDTTLSTTAKDLNKWDNAGWSAAQIKRFEEIERASHRVVAVGRSEEFIFYLMRRDDRWFLAAIHRFEPCSA